MYIFDRPVKYGLNYLQDYMTAIYKNGKNLEVAIISFFNMCFKCTFFIIPLSI